MLPTLYPGAPRDDVLKTLREIASAAQNADNTHGGAYARLTAYLEWATNSVRMLEHRVSATDIDRLVLTRGYERLLTAAGNLTGTDIGTSRVLNGMLSLEIRQRIADLDDAAKVLYAQIQAWGGDAAFTTPDTSFYLKHEHKLKSIDFQAELGVLRLQSVRVIVPMVVLDELDRLKESGDQHTRWRAGHTLGVMDEAFAATPIPGLLRALTESPVTGAVFLDVVFDPPRHVRLPIADDEIIERALAVQALAGRKVPLLTFDTSQSSRARHAGLPCKKLTKPLGEEPQPNTRGSRSNRPRAAPSAAGSHSQV